VAQSVKRLALGFSSGHDPMGYEAGSLHRARHSARSWLEDSLPLPLPQCVCTGSLSKKQINLKIPIEEQEQQEKKRGKMEGKGKGTRHALNEFTVK